VKDRAVCLLAGAMCLTITLVVLPMSISHAQIPDEFTNLKVLPAHVSKGELLETMKSFTQALDVRCVTCHVGEEGQPLSTFDFASDEKEEKLTARTMLRMVNAINGEYLSKLEDDDHPPKISCMTCHRGQRHPQTTGEALDAAYAAGGVDSVISCYRGLRSEFYGGGGYDFREPALNSFAAGLSSAGKPDEAVRVLMLNAEFHPESDRVHALIGMSYMESGDPERAEASLRKALELNPNNPWVKQMLERISGE
jgi:tetratricopeptide (TPR) repeat protein